MPPVCLPQTKQAGRMRYLQKHSKWRCSRCAKWLRAECTIIWAAVFIVTRSIVTGTYPISRRCFTTRRSSRSPISMRFKSRKIDNIESVARDILDYVARDMTSKEGGFFSAEDADSPVVAGGETRPQQEGRRVLRLDEKRDRCRAGRCRRDL